MEKFYLDLTDDGRWLIKRGNERYVAGRDKAVAVKLIARLNAAYRPNVEQTNGGDLYVCWNLHNKEDDCDYVCEIKNDRDNEKRPI